MKCRVIFDVTPLWEEFIFLNGRKVDLFLSYLSSKIDDLTGYEIEVPFYIGFIEDDFSSSENRLVTSKILKFELNLIIDDIIDGLEDEELTDYELLMTLTEDDSLSIEVL